MLDQQQSSVSYDPGVLHLQLEKACSHLLCSRMIMILDRLSKNREEEEENELWSTTRGTSFVLVT